MLKIVYFVMIERIQDRRYQFFHAGKCRSIECISLEQTQELRVKMKSFCMRN
jgi:hypothetical protein